MTLVLIFIFTICILLLIFLQRKDCLSFIWNNIGKPYLDYLFKPSDYKIIKVYIGAIVAILGGVAALNLTFGVTEKENGKTTQFLFGVEFGSIECYTFIIAIALILLAALHLYLRHKKDIAEFIKRKRTLIVEYRANIAEDSPLFDYDIIKEALPGDMVPSDSSPQEIDYEGVVEDDWGKAVKHLEDNFNSLKIFISKAKTTHISLFALAPMPLLVKLGTLFNEKCHVDVYQRHRDPANWNRLEEDTPAFNVSEPSDFTKQPVIAFSLSADISKRIKDLYGDTASIWYVSVENPNMDMMRTLKQQNEYKELVRNLLSDISKVTGHDTINIHMAMPISCAVELGRVWMPKAHKSLVLYDYYNKTENKTISIEHK